jgi:hypothetical protein
MTANHTDLTLSSNGVVLGMFVTFWAPLCVVRALLTTVRVVNMNSWNERRKGAETSCHLHLFHLPFTFTAPLAARMLNTHGTHNPV